ncbi:MAG: C-GCAxxG-C-C family protein [Clostridiales bacterium]|nr:C-GCAxxG-C-C family protein [Clostridiales bacterium]
MNAKDRVFEEKLKGHCCSESIMNMCLEDMGWEPEARQPLIKSMGAYCGGLHEGLACGTLCAANAVLWIAEEDYNKAHDELGPEMMAWFKERFGSWNCTELLEGDEARKPIVCPPIVEDTYLKLHDMLEDIGAV